jgi:hypothetical protein
MTGGDAMANCRRAVTVVAVAGLLWAGAAVAAERKDPQCDKTPKVLSGTVTRVDPARMMVTVTDTSGTVHEFQVAKETMDDLKVGDQLEGKLRANPNCP